ncbi:MAG: restriction endonuclease subunit R, partial [Candidatus Eisenbacteria bacterium]|nr:restriction endonuclease subunit R [Candidatus Eisenbacteria bacterium]
DMKMYEPAMRHLLDTYIRAEESEKLSAFDDLTLVTLIVERGEQAVRALPAGLRESREAMAETIENNVRRLIIDEMAVNPKYYEKMSGLLDALIKQRRREAMDYKAYLAKIVELTKKVSRPEAGSTYPSSIDTGSLRAFYDNLEESYTAAVRERPQAPYGGMAEEDLRTELAIAVDRAIREVKKADWRGNRFKEREVRNAIRQELGDDEALVDAMFEIAKAQRDY